LKAASSCERSPSSLSWIDKAAFTAYVLITVIEVPGKRVVVTLAGQYASFNGTSCPYFNVSLTSQYAMQPVLLGSEGMLEEQCPPESTWNFLGQS
jgi:hypothetical protein